MYDMHKVDSNSLISKESCWTPCPHSQRFKPTSVIHKNAQYLSNMYQHTHTHTHTLIAVHAEYTQPISQQ